MEGRYGLATRRVSGRQERYFVHESSRIVFRADPEGQVRGWTVYGIK